MKFDNLLNTKRNAIWGFLNKILVVIFPFLIKSLIITCLGVEYLGLNGLFTSILHVLNLAELGVGAAIVYSMYKPVAENDTKKICALLNLYKKIYRYIGLVVFVLGISLLPFLKYLVKNDVPENINIYILYLLSLANTVLSYWMFAYKNCILTVYQRADIHSKISSALMIFTYLMQIIFIMITKNYYIYVIWSIVETICKNLVTAYIVKKKHPEIVANGEIEKKTKKEIKKAISGLMLTKLNLVSRNAFDSIVVSMFLGLYSVAIYNNYYSIMNAISGFLLVGTSALKASIGNNIAVKTMDENLKIMNRLSFLYMWVSGWCAVCLCCLFQPFMELWVGKEFLFPDKIMWLFVVYFIVIKPENIMGQYFDAAGLWWHRKWYDITEAVSNLILNFVLGYFFGIYGILIATIVTTLVFHMLLSSKVIFKHYFKYGYYKYIMSQGGYVLIILLTCAVSYYICNLITGAISSVILVLLVRLLLCAIIPNVIFLALYFKTNIFKDTLDWLKSKGKFKLR